MVFHLLFQLALIVIVIRSVYVAYQNITRKSWFEMLFHIAIAIAAFNFIDILKL